MSLTSILFTTLTAGVLTSPWTFTPGATPCLDACVDYLEQGEDALRCQSQCVTDASAPASDAAYTDIPAWVPTASPELQATPDHSWCLATCDDPETSETDRETCRLNCAASWSVLSEQPSVCDARVEGALCVDDATLACERGCFASAVTCRDACHTDSSARATDVASCELRCANVNDLCAEACMSDDPDDYVSSDSSSNTTQAPGC